jgi:AcrR family transcriptional regulator
MSNRQKKRLPLRADAARNVTQILDAAVETLGRNPDASIADIAAAASVVRQTVYAHYKSREALIEAVLARAADEIGTAMTDAEIAEGPPVEALRRFVEHGWVTLERHYSLILNPAARTSSQHLHSRLEPISRPLDQLIRRGQRAGVFATGLSPRWLFTMTVACAHAAVEEAHTGRARASAAKAALIETLLRLYGADDR